MLFNAIQTSEALMSSDGRMIGVIEYGRRSSGALWVYTGAIYSEFDPALAPEKFLAILAGIKETAERSLRLLDERRRPRSSEAFVAASVVSHSDPMLWDR